MLQETVGILGQFGNSSSGRAQQKPNNGKSNGVTVPPNPIKTKKQINLRQSPELTEEERRILPQWAVCKNGRMEEAC